MERQEATHRILRCYGHEINPGKWYGMCIDLDLSVEADSPESLRAEMKDVIVGYIEAVLNTDDKVSIKRLLNRKSPLRYQLTYYYIRAVVSINRFRKDIQKKLTFNEVLPCPSAA